MVQTIKIRRTLTPNNPPANGALSEGELQLGLGDNPIRLWVGTASGPQQLLPVLPLPPGGVQWDYLVKNSATAGDALWQPVGARPENCTVVGRNAAVNIGTWTARNAIAVGHGAQAQRDGAIAIGYAAQLWDNYSIAIGYQANVAGGENAIAIGCQASVLGENSIAIGANAVVDGYYANTIVLGNEQIEAAYIGTSKIWPDVFLPMAGGTMVPITNDPETSGTGISITNSAVNWQAAIRINVTQGWGTGGGIQINGIGDQWGILFSVTDGLTWLDRLNVMSTIDMGEYWGAKIGITSSGNVSIQRTDANIAGLQIRQFFPDSIATETHGYAIIEYAISGVEGGGVYELYHWYTGLRDDDAWGVSRSRLRDPNNDCLIIGRDRKVTIPGNLQVDGEIGLSATAIESLKTALGI